MHFYLRNWLDCNLYENAIHLSSCQSKEYFQLNDENVGEKDVIYKQKDN